MKKCIAFLFLMIGLLPALFFACGEKATPWETDQTDTLEGTSVCPVGSFGCPCDSDGCGPGLSCVSSVCVQGDRDAGDSEEVREPDCIHTCITVNECATRGIVVLGATCADTDEICCNPDS